MPPESRLSELECAGLGKNIFAERRAHFAQCTNQQYSFTLIELGLVDWPCPILQ